MKRLANVKVHYRDGSATVFSASSASTPLYVEVDGTRYENMGVQLVEHYEDGECVAIDYDGVRYVKETPAAPRNGAWTGTD